jgi:hypothetical protein
MAPQGPFIRFPGLLPLLFQESPNASAPKADREAGRTSTAPPTKMINEARNTLLSKLSWSAATTTAANMIRIRTTTASRRGYGKFSFTAHTSMLRPRYCPNQAPATRISVATTSFGKRRTKPWIIWVVNSVPKTFTPANTPLSKMHQ